MDQAESQDQIVSRHRGECGAIPNLGGDDVLSAPGLHQIPDEVRQTAAGAYAHGPGDDLRAQEPHRSLVLGCPHVVQIRASAYPAVGSFLGFIGQQWAFA